MSKAVIMCSSPGLAAVPAQAQLGQGVHSRHCQYRLTCQGVDDVGFHSPSVRSTKGLGSPARWTQVLAPQPSGSPALDTQRNFLFFALSKRTCMPWMRPFTSRTGMRIPRPGNFTDPAAVLLIKPWDAGQVPALLLKALRQAAASHQRGGLVPQAGNVLLAQAASEKVLPVVGGQGEACKQRRVGSVPGVHVCQGVLLHKRRVMEGMPDCRHRQPIPQGGKHLLLGILA